MENRSRKQEFILWRVIDKVLSVSTVILLLSVLFLMTLQIVMRYVFSRPLTWSEELAKYSMVWMTFLGSALAVAKKAHVCVDLVVGAFPQKAQKVIGYLTKCLSLVFLAAVTYYGIEYVKMNLKNYSLISGICKGHVYLVIPISAVLMIIGILRTFREEG